MNTVKRYRVKPLIILALILILVFTAIRFLSIERKPDNTLVAIDTPVTEVVQIDTPIPLKTDTVSAPVTETAQLATTGNTINTGLVSPNDLVKYAETLIGVPYVWASTDPQVGFDCSGFITYVFNHFNIAVPRSSIDFTDIGNTVALENAKRGDLILFTGTNPMEKDIGHMGIVVSNTIEGLQFIHSTSGKAMAVTISKLSDQYRKRFVRISRIFDRNS